MSDNKTDDSLLSDEEIRAKIPDRLQDFGEYESIWNEACEAQAALTASHYEKKIKELEEEVKGWISTYNDENIKVRNLESKLHSAEQETARKITQDLKWMLDTGDKNYRIASIEKYVGMLESKYGVSK